MRFALLGNHPDGLEMASALVESGRHELVACTGAAIPTEYLSRWGPAVKRVGDLEEVLANPAVEAVIVAGNPENRPYQLRRALQAERHVLCVYPPDQSPDIAYETAMIQKDTGRVLMPILHLRLHPALLRLKSLLDASGSLLGGLRLIELEYSTIDEFFIGDLSAGDRFSLPMWDIMKMLGGEIAEVASFVQGEELTPGGVLLLAGRFARARRIQSPAQKRPAHPPQPRVKADQANSAIKALGEENPAHAPEPPRPRSSPVAESAWIEGAMFQVRLIPGAESSSVRLTVHDDMDRAELLFPQGLPGAAILRWKDRRGDMREEAWDIWDPWPRLVEEFERHIGLLPAKANESLLTWQDATRCLELDDAVRRSLKLRRSITLEHPEPTEEAGFKGMMTLVGCSFLWLTLGLVIAAAKWPWLLFLIGPALALFLALQFLRWIIPGQKAKPNTQPPQANEPEA